MHMKKNLFLCKYSGVFCEKTLSLDPLSDHCWTIIGPLSNQLREIPGYLGLDVLTPILLRDDSYLPPITML